MLERQKRLEEVYDYLRGHYGVHTKAGFADSIGYARAYISSAINGNEKYLTDKLFVNISEAYPGVFDLNYLLTGSGNLLTVEEDVRSQEIENMSDNKLANETIMALKKQVEILEQRIEDKDMIIKMKDQFIQVLESRINLIEQSRTYHNQAASFMTSDPLLDPEK